MRAEIKLMLRTIAFFVVASIPLLALYIAVDPLKCLRFHDDYYTRGTQFCGGMVSVVQFKHYYPTERYNSYILGSSLSRAFMVDDWTALLPAGAKATHFDSSGQPLSDLRKSLEYLDKNSQQLDNVLIVLSPGVLLENRNRTESSFIYMFPPEVAGMDTWLKYHWENATSALNYEFLDGFVNHRILGVTLTRPNRYPVSNQPIVYNPTTHEEKMPEWDEILANHPEDFSKIYEFQHIDKPVTRDTLLLTAAQIEDFKAIAKTLQRRHTNYRVVIGPNIKHVDFSKRDDDTLRTIFGTNYVNLIVPLDSMVKPQYFYDDYHYTPVVAREIMRRAYPQR